MALVIVFGDVRSDAVNGEGAILDPIGIAADNGTVVSVVRLGILEVPRAIVVAEDDVLRVAVLVIDKELGQTCTISYKGSIDARRRNGVFLKGILLRKSSKNERRGC